MSEMNDHQIEVPPARTGIPGQLDEQSLHLMPGLTHEQWMSVGETIRFFERGVMWWLGDWWNYGERAYGDMASQAAKDSVLDATGYDYDTVRAAGWVAARIPHVRRRTNLSWSHHREVAAMPPDDQDYWLDRSIEEGWNRTDLRTALRGGDPDDASVLTRIECPQCGYQWEAE